MQQQVRGRSLSAVRRCIAPEDEHTLELAPPGSPEELLAGGSSSGEEMDIQQQVQQEEEAMEQQLVMATAMTADGGRVESALLSVNRWPMMDM